MRISTFSHPCCNPTTEETPASESGFSNGRILRRRICSSQRIRPRSTSDSKEATETVRMDEQFTPSATSLDRNLDNERTGSLLETPGQRFSLVAALQGFGFFFSLSLSPAVSRFLCRIRRRNGGRKHDHCRGQHAVRRGGGARREYVEPQWRGSEHGRPRPRLLFHILVCFLRFFVREEERHELRHRGPGCRDF